jgi:DNA-binding MurR/RpiR family transcriptional regulator
MSQNEKSSVPRNVMLRIRTRYTALSPAERAVCEVIKNEPEMVINMTLIELAAAANVSDTTALRLSRSLGFKGFNEMKMALVADLTELPMSTMLEDIHDQDGVVEIANKVIKYNIQLLQDTLETLDGESLEQAVKMLLGAERILVFALGTSGPLADEMHNMLLRLGLNVSAFTEGYIQLMKATMVSKNDVVVVISRSGMPKTLTLSVEEARQRGAKIISLVCDPDSPIARNSDISIVGVSREITSEAVASKISLETLMHTIYVSIALADRASAVRHESDISRLLREHRRG